MTDDIADAAEAWISNATEPWFAYVAFLAAHSPFHCPPEGPDSPYPGVDFQCTEADVLSQYHSMIQALDIDFGTSSAPSISARHW